MKKFFGYDDSLDAWGVHGVGGALGGLLTGLFASSAINPAGKGWAADGNAWQMLIQLYAVVGVFAYSALVTYLILKLVDVMMGLRVSAEVEGLDINLHSERVGH